MNKVKVQIEFETPLLVSFDEPNFLIISFNELAKEILEEHRELRKKLKRQLP